MEGSAAQGRLGSKTVTWVSPRDEDPQLSRLSGLEAMRSILEGALPAPPICALMSFEMIEVERGRVSFRGHPGNEHYNPIGSVHGGFAATLLDSAMGCAIHSTLERGVGYTTAELSVNFIKAIVARSGPVRCDGVVIHTGRRIATAEGRLYLEETQKLLAHGKTTAIILA